jgi:hypothetical protein
MTKLNLKARGKLTHSDSAEEVNLQPLPAIPVVPDPDPSILAASLKHDHIREDMYTTRDLEGIYGFSVVLKTALEDLFVQKRPSSRVTTTKKAISGVTVNNVPDP